MQCQALYVGSGDTGKGHSATTVSRNVRVRVTDHDGPQTSPWN